MSEQNKEPAVEIEVLRDYWDAKGDRVKAGTRLFVPVSAAMDGVETGALTRVKGNKK